MKIFIIVVVLIGSTIAQAQGRVLVEVKDCGTGFTQKINLDGTMTCGPAVLPSGTVTLVTSGTCPSGTTEVVGLNHVMLRGTLAANGDVGTTAGSDSITPTVATLTAAAQTFTGDNGTVPAQTFTGSNVTSSAVSAGTPAGTNASVSITPLGSNAASATSGNCAATNIAAGTGSTTACKATAPNLTVTAQTFTGSSTTVGAQAFTGSALGTHTHTLTATGTNGTVAFTPVGTNGTSSVTGTLNSFDNRPAYINVIFCKAN